MRCEACGAPRGEHDSQGNCPTTAVDWLMAVRKHGIEAANRMYPEG